MYSSLLIGRFAEVIRSYDKSLLGKSGKVSDETKNMIHITTEAGETIRLPKSVVTLRVGLQSDYVILEGTKLLGTPIDRIRG